MATYAICYSGLKQCTITFYPLHILKNGGGIKTGLVRHLDWKKAYISESIEHSNLKLKLLIMQKQYLYKMLLGISWLIRLIG